jgi:hypothetical protein
VTPAAKSRPAALARSSRAGFWLERTSTAGRRIGVEILLVIGAIVVGMVLIGLLIWVAVALGVVAFIAYVIAAETGISFQFLFVAGVIAAVVFFLWAAFFS